MIGWIWASCFILLPVLCLFLGLLMHLRWRRQGVPDDRTWAWLLIALGVALAAIEWWLYVSMVRMY